MSTAIQFTPLWGASADQPLCYLLELDDFCFLLDCGWTDEFDIAQIQPLKDVIHRIDAVLVSHSDVWHLGALPYAVGKLGLSAPVFATLPVHKMGQMFMYDVLLSKKDNEDFDTFDLDDIDAAFDLFKQLKYSQHHRLSGKGSGITVTPYCAGHMIGGTIWRIAKESEEIIYAVDYNHTKDRHLNGAVLEMFSRPNVLITDAYNVLVHQAPRKARDAQLIDLMLGCLRGNGKVLMPVDTAGRVFELLMFLDQYWVQSRLSQYPLVLFTHTGYNTTEFAKSQIEWCSDQVVKAFDNLRENPFVFKYVNIIHTREELAQYKDRPLVLLASMPTLNTGYSRELFIDWVSSPSNLVLFTDRSVPASLAHDLLATPTPQHVTVTVKKKVPLEGQELADYEDKKREEKEREARQKRLTLLSDEFVQQSAQDEGDEIEPDGEILLSLPKEVQVTRTTSLGVISLTPKSKDINIQASTIENNKTIVAVAVGGGGGRLVRAGSGRTRLHLMYKFKESAVQWDDYGEITKPEDYMDPNAEYDEMGMKDVGENEGAEGEEEEDETIPTKCIAQQVAVDVRCRIEYVDYEGRSDGPSIKRIVAQVAPRKMIIVHGSDESSQSLASHFSRHLGVPVFVPANGEKANIPIDTNVYKVKLNDSLASSLSLVQVGEYEVGYVNCKVEVHPSAGGVSMAVLPTLDVAPLSEVKPHNAIFVGDLKLSDFKQTLHGAGVTAEFTGDRSLLCNGSVNVKKMGPRKVCMEGVIGEDFFRVRELLYSQFVVL